MMRLIDWLRGRNGAPGVSNLSARTVDEVVREARGLADAGRYKEAIELLTTANRGNRQREIERTLLALRSEGYLAGAWKAESPKWPSQVADQFSGEGIPEIRADELSALLVRSGIENHGSLIVRGIIPSSQVDMLRNNIDRVLEAFDAVEWDTVSPENVGWYEPFDRDTIVRDRVKKRSKGAMLTADSPPALFDLLETFDSCGLSAVIREFFGEPPVLVTRKGTLRRVRPGGYFAGWHQDGAFMGENIRSLNVWIALTDCGVDAPGMDIVAKRLPGIVKTGSKFAAWTTNPDAIKEIAEGHTVRPVFAAGDAIIFDHLCLHRTAAAYGMTNIRYAIETWLVAPSTYGKAGVPILF